MDLKVHRNKIVQQLKTGYNILTLSDKRSQYRADFILESRGEMPRHKGSLQGLVAYYQPPEYLVLSKLRIIKATQDPERRVKDKDDIRAILALTKVSRQKLVTEAREDSTLEILRRLLQENRSRKK